MRSYDLQRIYSEKARLICGIMSFTWFPDYDKTEFHIDHKFSISEGFKQQIPLWIIGNRNNLELLPKVENMQKGSKCSISYDELIATADPRIKTVAAMVAQLSVTNLRRMQEKMIMKNSKYKRYCRYR
jgi:hypothetical protein